jgi:hypothetical protein
MTTPIDELTARLAHLADNETDEARLARTVEALRAAEEARKLFLEADNLRRTSRSEETRYYVSVLAPLISAVVLAATLIFQVWQFRTEGQARADAEIWKSFDALGDSDPVRATLTASQLQFLYGSSQYRDKARQLALGFMRMVVSPEIAEPVFRPLMQDTKWSELDKVIAVNRAILARYELVLEEVGQIEKDLEEIEGAEAAGQPSKPLEARQKGARAVLASKEAEKDAIDQQLSFMSGEIAKFLRGEIAGWRPPGVGLDLSGAAWWSVDLSGADLHGANFYNAWVWEALLDRADLSGIESFEDSRWSDANWWKARAISPKLLEYLTANFPCDAGCEKETDCLEACAVDIARLRSNADQPY